MKQPHHNLQLCIDCRKPWCGEDYEGYSCKCQSPNLRWATYIENALKVVGIRKGDKITIEQWYEIVK